MNKKQIIGWSIGIVVAIVVISVGIVAATIGGEASKLDSSLKQDIAAHMPLADVQTQLTSMGLKLAPTDASGALNATGQAHWAIVYGTWLTVHATFSPDQKMTGYTIERASAWF